MWNKERKIKCERCWKEIIKRNPQHRYCSKCSSQINREKSKERHRLKKQNQ